MADFEDTEEFVVAVVTGNNEDVELVVERVDQAQSPLFWSLLDLYLEAELICWSSHWK